tara:strand:- start:401 stop:628 length:228 start_codon:yes stop_codon:yes gene_type:complete
MKASLDKHDLEKSELKKMYDDHDMEKTRQEKELRDEIEALKFLILMSFFRVLHLISRDNLLHFRLVPVFEREARV